jgi:DNA invertase Pin-like site-specific DNA recombinase
MTEIKEAKMTLMPAAPGAPNPDKVNAMLRLRKSGYTLAQIGKMFGCSRQRVHEYLKKHCLEVPNG